MKKVLLALVIAILTGSSYLAYAAKPLSPIQVNIEPVQAGIASANIRPGDIVELRIVSKSFVDAGELAIRCYLHGGAVLLAGETTWIGPVKKGDVKTLLITVRAPRHGIGVVRARAAMSPSIGASFAAEAEFRLGPDVANKPAPMPEIKRDHKGREIKEYRIK